MKTTAEMRAVYATSMDVSRADALAILQEHEAEARADERAMALAKIRVIRAGVANVSADASWTTAEVLEEIDGIIKDIGGDR